MATVEQLQADYETLRQAMVKVASGIYEEYTINGKRVRYKSLADVQAGMELINSLLATQQGARTYAGFADPL
jgi:hypothetical protein